MLASAALALGVGFWATRERPAELWTASWLSVLAAGALVYGPEHWASPAIGVLSPLFPGAQLAGALAFVRGRAPWWVALATIGIGLLRGASEAAAAGSWGGLGSLDLWIGLVLEPAGSLACAALLARQARREGGGRAQGLLLGVAALVAASALVDGASAWTRVSAGSVPLFLGALWIGLAAGGLPLQLYVAGSSSVRRQAQLRQRAETALHHTQERFRALTESAFDLVAELDGDERFTYVNPRYEEVLGYPRETLLGRFPTDLMHPDDQPSARPFAEAASQAGRASGLVVRARHRNGHYLWLENAASAFTTAEGERRWVMNSRDVTERKARELLHERARERLEEAVTESTAALQESEARFRALADHAPELISEFDGLGRYTFANAAFRDLLGRDPLALLGTTPEPLVHPDDLEASRTGMARALAEHGRSHAVHRLRHADGSWRWFDNTGRAYFTGRGKLRFVSIGRDITEARLAEAERSRLEAHMQEVQRLESLGRAGGRHRPRLQQPAGGDPGQRCAARDRRGLRGGAARPGTPHPRRGAPCRVPDRPDAGLRRQGRRRAGGPRSLGAGRGDRGSAPRVRVPSAASSSLELAPGLPAVRGDPTQLRQVLLNLVTNASEAYGEGAGRVRVRTGCVEADAGTFAGAFGAAERRPGRWVFLEVSDDGPGIGEELRGRIFEPFYSTRGVGRGLGLAAVVGIASAHQGVVKVESEPGRGTTFRLLVPPCDAAFAATSAAPAPREKAPHGRESRSNPDPAGATREAARAAGLVLVVDDDEGVRDVAEGLLAETGFRVETAAGGNAALARVREGGVDAVLLDLVMPDLSGADVLRVLAAERPDLPVVIASGYKRELAAERIGQTGAFAFVQKPFDPETLCATLRDALEKRRGAASRSPAP